MLMACWLTAQRRASSFCVRPEARSRASSRSGGRQAFEQIEDGVAALFAGDVETVVLELLFQRIVGAVSAQPRGRVAHPAAQTIPDEQAQTLGRTFLVVAPHKFEKRDHALLHQIFVFGAAPCILPGNFFRQRQKAQSDFVQLLFARSASFAFH